MRNCLLWLGSPKNSQNDPLSLYAPMTTKQRAVSAILLT